MKKIMKYAMFLLAMALAVMGCNEDPIEDEVKWFTATFNIDSIRTVNYQTGVKQLFTSPAEFILKERQKKDTIYAFGDAVEVEPGFDENILLLSRNLASFEFVKVCSNNNMNNFEVSGDHYVGYWFPDLNQKRLTFWTLTGTGQYRVVLTVSGNKDRQEWTYVRTTELGASATQSALRYKEVIYVHRK